MQLYMSDIPTITPDDEYSEVIECDYKGEHYSVRDNGAIMRHAREGKPIRKDDNVWTFGKKDEKTGYMISCGARVHIIVATAFLGEHDSTKLVVDHKDTNRCNNRADNLRWLTRLENALNNPATLKKITYLCGGDIQKFLDNPSCLRDTTGTNQDVMWMRSVSAEEARNAFERIMSWAARPSDETLSKGGKIGEWIYSKEQDHHPELITQGGYFSDFARGMEYDIDGNPLGPRPSRKEKKILANNTDYFETSNPLAVQIGWAPHTKPEFPCCPDKIEDNPLQEYAANLEGGKPFVDIFYGPSTVYEYTIHKDKLIIITRLPESGPKSFGLAEVLWNGSVFIHKAVSTYFEENGVRAAYAREQGKVWDGPESIDDYC